MRNRPYNTIRIPSRPTKKSLEAVEKKQKDLKKSLDKKEKVDFLPPPDEWKTAGTKIIKFDTDFNKIPQRPHMETQLIPNHPCRTYICGASNQGKSNLLMNLFSRPDFYGPVDKSYFDKVYLFSPTALMDSLIRYLGIPKSQIFSKLDISQIEKILAEQEEDIKKIGDVSKADKICLIFDDSQSNKKFLNSKVFMELCIFSRHLSVSIFFLGQCYNKAPNFLRTNSSHVIYFAGSCNENEKVVDDHTPARHTKEEFRKILDHCTKEQYSFIYMRDRVPPSEKYCKCFDYVLKLNK